MEFEYGNHSSADTFGEAVWEKAVEDVARSTAISSPKEMADPSSGVARVTSRGRGIIDDMTFEHKDGCGGGAGNATTDWDEIPTWALSGVMR